MSEVSQMTTGELLDVLESGPETAAYNAALAEMRVRYEDPEDQQVVEQLRGGYSSFAWPHPLMKLIIPAIALYLGGQLWFSMTALFNTEWDGNTLWEKFYFLWQDTSGAGWLVWFLVYRLVSETTYRKLVLPVLIYSIFIFTWDLASYITDFGANHPIMTGAIFGAGALVVAYFMAVDVIKRWKS